MKQEKTGLRGNRYANFIGEFEAATTFEMLLPQEYLNMT
jgi:hypothetical protein